MLRTLGETKILSHSWMKIPYSTSNYWINFSNDRPKCIFCVPFSLHPPSLTLSFIILINWHICLTPPPPNQATPTHKQYTFPSVTHFVSVNKTSNLSLHYDFPFEDQCHSKTLYCKSCKLNKCPLSCTWLGQAFPYTPPHTLTLIVTTSVLTVIICISDYLICGLKMFVFPHIFVGDNLFI